MSASDHRPLYVEPDELQTLPTNALQKCRKIFKLPSKRGIQLRPGRELKGLEKERINLEAALGYKRGDVADMPCPSCSDEKRPKGPFLYCVILNGYREGACANCWYNGDGSCCNFHADNRRVGRAPRCQFYPSL